MANTVKTLQSAKKVKNDEFYTQRSDIEAELQHYKKYFKGKTVYCNCDDPKMSNFFHYFSHQFEHLKLERLITTCYKNDSRDLFSRHNKNRAIMLDYKRNADANGGVPKVEDINTRPLKGDGDFRSDGCIELLKEADIVVTNPPFSLFREYVTQLVKHKKKFLIIGSMNAISYKEIFSLFKGNKLWIGNGFTGGNAYFRIPPHTAKDFAKGVYDKKTKLVKFRNVTWFTNLDHKKRHEKLHLVKRYNPKEYPKYDNYSAINVNKIADIPRDYAGCMGVPVTFLNKFNPDQFEIIGMAEDNGRGFSGGIWDGKNPRCIINGKAKFKRIFIKNKNPQKKK